MEGTVSSEDDFISNLPHSIIENILGRVHLKFVVRTSSLSREWRYKWLSCPNIVFDFWFDEILLGDGKLKPLIYQILERHQGPLLKFALQLPHLETCPDIDHWVHLLPNHSLQNLTLHVPGVGKHMLTPYLFTFQNLRFLKLFNCEINIPPGFEGFQKLESVDLHNCSLVPETFGKFIASCPVMERMRLIQCTSFDCLEIIGPKLKYFNFSGAFESISFKNCPVLSNVKLLSFYYGFRDGQFPFDLIKSLSCLPLLEDLELQAEALEDLVVYGATNKLPAALKMLKKLHLSGVLFQKTVLSVICFIQSCPNLQTLEITAWTYEVDGSVANFLHLQNIKRPESLTHLRTVKILLFSGLESEMGFTKYLLASATALEEMVITLHERSNMDGGEILNELKQYPCASPKVETRIISIDGEWSE